MIKKIRPIKKWKIRTKLSVLILFSAVLCIIIFGILWKQQTSVLKFLENIPALTWDKEAFIEELKSTAIQYDVPDSEWDEEAQEAIRPFLDAKDKYTGIYVYEIGGKGLYRCGAYPEIMDQLLYRSFLSLGYWITGGGIEFYDDIPVDFHNGQFSVMIFSYHTLLLMYPYLIFVLAVCLGTFLGLNLFFINRRMNHIICIKDEILRMSSGDLSHCVPDCGEDELGVLGEELNHLRMTLKTQIEQEEESREANKDLITAISHDLRTPLTILNGYLEVLKLDRIPEIKKEEYLNRCLQKVSEIKGMTDRMFEYALVYEVTEAVNAEEIPLSAIRQMLMENLDYLGISGFMSAVDMEEIRGFIVGDSVLLKRIFSNLFSNILKYGDKKEPIKIYLKEKEGHIKIRLCNKIKAKTGVIESSRVGLKSAEKMAEMQGGRIFVCEDNGEYCVEMFL